MFALGLAMFATSQLALAQTKAKTEIEERELITGDDLKLKITYFKSTSKKDASVIILLHGKLGARQNWKGLAADLQSKADFAVVAVDLRGHGESPLGSHKKSELKKADYVNMVEFDLRAVKDFVFDEHQKGNLNMNKMGIVACDFSASLAVLFTEFDWERTPYDDSPTEADRTPRGQDVRALVLISPELNAPGLITTNAVRALRVLHRPVMIGVAEKNARDVAAANKLFEQLSPKKEREKEDEKDKIIWYQQYEGELRGIELVNQNSKTRAHIVGFLKTYVQDYQSDWRDRRSRLERD